MIFLETARTVLRNVAQKDLDEMADYRNDERCSRYQREQTRDRDCIAALLARRAGDVLGREAPCMLAVADKETDALLGEVVVMPSEGTISLGYTFSYKYQRQGYAYEVLTALIAHLHTAYPDWDFVSFTDPRNLASMRLLLKLGYRDMGYLPSKDSRVFGKWLTAASEAEICAAVRAEESIVTARLRMAPFSAGDADALAALLQNEGIKKTYMIPDLENKTQLERMVERFFLLSHDGTHFVRGVYLQNELVGFVNDVEIRDERMELGFVIAPAHWGQGFATEALRGVIDALLGKRFLTIRTGAFAENAASIRVMQKCGMHQIPLTETIEYREQAHTCVYYEISACECRA